MDAQQQVVEGKGRCAADQTVIPHWPDGPRTSWISLLHLSRAVPVDMTRWVRLSTQLAHLDLDMQPQTCRCTLTGN